MSVLLTQEYIENSFERYNRIGLGVSLGGHVLLLYVMILGIGSGLGQIPEHVVYSVSMEGSATRGGIAQVPDKKNEKAPVAPPKNVTKKAEAPRQEKKVVPEKVTAEPVKEVPAVEDAEISLKEKATPKPTAKPTAKPTPVPKKTKAPEPKPKATPAQKPVQAKPVPAAKAKVEPRKDPVADANKNFEQALQRYLGESTSAGGTGFGGDGRGGQGMGGGIVKPPAWFLYKDALEMSVKRGWNWHDTSAQLFATVAFRIAADGTVSNVHLVRSSGNSHYDESIIRAVRKASPVPPPPQEFYDDFRFVELDFIPH